MVGVTGFEPATPTSRKFQESTGCEPGIVLAKIANMSKQVSASDAKNNFGGLLDDVAALGRVDIMKHGRLVAVVLSPRVLSAALGEAGQPARVMRWGEKHMIPPERARAARMIRPPLGFDEE